MPRTLRRSLPLLIAAALVPLTALPSVGSDADWYHNPLKPQIPNDGVVTSCADPTVLHGQRPGDRNWYMYCTTDPLNDRDTAGDGPIDFHPIPMMRSRDLVNWKYVGDALPTPPSWAETGAGLWAPDVVYSKAYDRYYLTYVVTNVDESVSGEPNCTSDSAIGVAWSDSPIGPWHTSETPVVPPRRGGDGCNFLWTYDPDVLGDTIGANGILYYGSYYGGIYGTHVSVGARTIKMTGAPVQISVGDRYEGTNVIRRGDWYYFFGSATNCCKGPLTGYSVFVGRSQTPLGPYVDREGNSLLASRVGGTPVLSMNGNRWVGTGHNSVFRDFDGQWWTIYHAVDRHDPYFRSEPGFTKRPALLDPVDWFNGWPTVRANRWASDKRMPAPAAQPGEESLYRPDVLGKDRMAHPLFRLSDNFKSGTMGRLWRWVRKPAADQYEFGNERFKLITQRADLYEGSNTASVLHEPTPNRDYMVQTKVKLPVPPDGSVHNYVQAGLVIYDGDDKFIKLVHVSIWGTRQTEFAKEVPPGREGYPRYGNTVIGPPDDWTYLRIVKRHTERPNGKIVEFYTGYTSQDGDRWVRGGTWTHNLGGDARIGLVSMGAGPAPEEQYLAEFEYVRVWAVQPPG